MSFMDWWKERTTNERFAIGGASFVFVAALSAAAFWAFRPTYEILFSGLDAQDTSSVASHLSKASIDYKLDAKEGNVLVLKSEIQNARLQVAEEGLPLQKPQGFELFDQADFGMTDFAQRINFQRALEGELTRTITALDEVSRARLHLVLPEQGLFKRNEEMPKASLMLVLKPGEVLTPARVRGIQDLIASSVPGMKPENVTIHDHRGVSLSATPGGGNSEGVGGRLDSKRAMELYLTSKADEALHMVFPSDSIAVAIDVDLDLDARHVNRDETSSSVKPAGLQFSLGTSLPKATNSTTEESTPPPAGIKPFAGSEISRSVNEHVSESIDVAPGSIKKLTVGILIPPGWSAEGREGLIELVRNAVGADAGRGDRVSILQLPGGGAPSKPDDGLVSAPWNASDSTPAAARFDRKTVLIAMVVTGVLIVLFGLIGFGAGRRSSTRPMSARQRQQALSDLKRWLDVHDRPERV